MQTLKNVVAVDWRAGKDAIHFFFKDTNTYSRFDIGEQQIPEGYPSPVTAENWNGFHAYAKHLRFGFTTTGLASEGGSDDFSWLFYYVGDTPMVCKYDQDLDKVARVYRVENSMWAAILPYFDRIVAGTWWQLLGKSFLFRFIMNDGHYLSFDYLKRRIEHLAITAYSMPGLERYTHRIITAVQNDRTFSDSHYYIFLTHNQYLRYNIQQNHLISGPHPVNDVSWPGLLRD